MRRAALHVGDALETMRGMEAASVDAIVTDPPYGLSFMGKDWDHGIPGVAFWEAALQAAKPGAHLLAFGGTRTHHRLMCAIEDAGWEIRDCLMWVYGSGFPKSLDVGKAIDRRGGENEKFNEVRNWLRMRVKERGLKYKDIDTALGNVNSHKASHYLDNSQPQIPTPRDWEILKQLLNVEDDIERPGRFIEFEREVVGRVRKARSVNSASALPTLGGEVEYREWDITAPATDAAKQWDGWGTALKPAWEPIILARKPLTGTVAANVQEHGTGGLNIDGCRIKSTGDHKRPYMPTNSGRAIYGKQVGFTPSNAEGRWPANVVHDGSEEVVGLFPATTTNATGEKGTTRDGHNNIYGRYSGNELPRVGLGNSGSAARFFYCAKASRSEREAGLEVGERKMAGGHLGQRGSTRMGANADEGANTRERPQVRNNHPTVKPVALMRWLCRLVTPPNALILDPFCGSGSTGVAASLEGFRFVGIDVDAEYCEIARKRIAAANEQTDLFTGPGRTAPQPDIFDRESA